MQGYILKITPAKNEDVVLKILTPSHLSSFYRFYGARHSTIALGYKIDFEQKIEGVYLPQARNILHLAHSWEREYERVFIWQKFIQLLERHLYEVSEIEAFYYELLQKSAKKLGRQNPLRALLESYAQLLFFEGRLREEDKCFVCEGALDSEITLGRAFLFAHTKCVQGTRFEKQKILRFLRQASTIELEDSEVEKLWQILCLGF